jgi:hypothetical protein
MVMFVFLMNVFCKIFKLMVFVWLGLAMLVPSLHGIVLCIDDCGHVAIESNSHQGCCQDHEESGADAGNSSDILQSSVANHDCSDCIDLPLSDGEVSLLIKNINFSTLVRFKLVRVVDDMSAIFNHNELRTVQTVSFYDLLPERSAQIYMQKTTILRI